MKGASHEAINMVILNKKDINLLRTLYENMMGLSWEFVKKQAHDTSRSLGSANYYSTVDDCACILKVFDGIPFNQAGVLIVEDLVNILEGEAYKIDKYYKSEREGVKKDRKDLISLLKLPLEQVPPSFGHRAHEVRGEFVKTKGKESFVRLFAKWRLLIGK